MRRTRRESSAGTEPSAISIAASSSASPANESGRAWRVPISWSTIRRGPRTRCAVRSMVGRSRPRLSRSVCARASLLRQGHLRAAAEHSEKALAAASAFEVPKHFVTLDAHIALLGVLTDRDDLAAARRVVEQIESVTAGHPAFAYRIIGRLDEVRLAAARGLEDAFAVVDDLRILLHERDRPTLRSFVDAIEARLHLDVGETSRAEALADRLHPGTPASHLLVARLHLARIHNSRANGSTGPLSRAFGTGSPRNFSLCAPAS